jgi:hypothetical protein
MTLNPEFRRNLWLEFSLHRLVAMPAALGALFTLALISFGRGAPEATGKVALLTYVLIVFFWGTRRAAAALADEVRERTWDGQRMSALGPWTLTWGKLLGGTAFIWYGGFICLGVYVATQVGRVPPGVILQTVALQLLGGLLAQAVALGTCLTLLRKFGGATRLPVLFSQFLGLLVAAQTGIVQEGFGSTLGPGNTIIWYGEPYDQQLFTLASLAAFLAWTLLGTYRQMAVELQQRTLPWVWIAFMAFLMAYATGFIDLVAYVDGRPSARWLPLMPFFVGLALVYVTGFAEPKNVVAYRAFFAALAGRDLRRAGTLLPLWLLSFVALLVLAGVLLPALLPGPVTVGSERYGPAFSAQLSGAWVVACLLFLLRDIGLLLFLNFARKPRRADLAALIYLALLYGVAGGITIAADLTLLQPFFLPLPSAAPLVTLGPVFLEAVAVGLLLGWRWRRVAYAARPATDSP